jgi:hypothetical protein
MKWTSKLSFRRQRRGQRRVPKRWEGKLRQSGALSALLFLVGTDALNAGKNGTQERLMAMSRVEEANARLTQVRNLLAPITERPSDIETRLAATRVTDFERPTRFSLREFTSNLLGGTHRHWWKSKSMGRLLVNRPSIGEQDARNNEFARSEASSDPRLRHFRHFVASYYAVGKGISRQPRIGVRRQVLKSEEIAYAPIGYWLVRVTFEIISPRGPALVTILRDTMPWQGAPPRRGQAFRLGCDRSLHLDFVKGRIANY